MIDNGENYPQLSDTIFTWFMPITDKWCLDLCFVIFQGGAYLAVSSVAGSTFEVLSFLTVLFVLQIKDQRDWHVQWKKVFSAEWYNFYLVHASNRQVMFRFVFCDFPRWSVSESVSSGVKCHSYIWGFVLHNSFIFASNQKLTGSTTKKTILSWVIQFLSGLCNNRQVMSRFVFCACS